MSVVGPFFHSNLGAANDRDMLLGQFMGRTDPPVRVIIYTNAFGMGEAWPSESWGGFFHGQSVQGDWHERRNYFIAITCATN